MSQNCCYGVLGKTFPLAIIAITELDFEKMNYFFLENGGLMIKKQKLERRKRTLRHEVCCCFFASETAFKGQSAFKDPLEPP
jgi:hypothetical protein